MLSSIPRITAPFCHHLLTSWSLFIHDFSFTVFPNCLLVWKWFNFLHRRSSLLLRPQATQMIIYWTQMHKPSNILFNSSIPPFDQPFLSTPYCYYTCFLPSLNHQHQPLLCATSTWYLPWPALKHRLFFSCLSSGVISRLFIISVFFLCPSLIFQCFYSVFILELTHYCRCELTRREQYKELSLDLSKMLLI